MVDGPTDHSAAGPALGYLYQSYLPLLMLAQRASPEPGLTLSLELLDDVQFEQQGRPLELVQTKHRIDATGDLSDVSVDLWRTINVWMTALRKLAPGETPALTLVTTATAPAGSAASYLLNESDPDRDPERAQGRLESAATSSGNATTLSWRRRFLRLSPAQRATLVGAITVADGALTIADIDEELKRALFWVVPSDNRADAFIAYLRGWWLGVVIRLLRRELEAFAATDMLAYVQDLRDQFSPENLPTDPDLPDPDDNTIAQFEDRVFVRQLNLVAATNRQLAVAIRDYYKAFTQRSRWVRRELVGAGELGRYERKLREEWEFVFANLTAELSPESAEDEKQRCGRTLLADLAASAKARIRERYDEPFMTRGTLHELADQRHIGWHPDFQARLEELLGPVVVPDDGLD